MIKVGLTGEMGSGKSYCANLFENLGVPVFYSDDIARKVVNTSTELRNKICKEFGNIYDEDGAMIPSLIRSIVFVEGGEDNLKKLNQLVHPYVFEEFKLFCDKNSNQKYIIAESAILYEAGMDKVVDKVIYIQADEETRIKRTLKRSGISEKEYKQRMKDQIPNKAKMADFIILNNENSITESQIRFTHSCLSK